MKPFIDGRKHYADQPYGRAAYAAMVRMDRDVGRILSTLKERGIEDNTIVFFTSDNGGTTRLWSEDIFNSTGPLRGHRRNLYEGGIRVAMIARWLGKVPCGVTSNHPWAFWDIPPTFAELAGQMCHRRWMESGFESRLPQPQARCRTFQLDRGGWHKNASLPDGRLAAFVVLQRLKKRGER